MTPFPDFPMLLDIHTHRLPDRPETALLSCFPDTDPLPSGVVWRSAGLHPWHLSAGTLSSQLEWLERQLADPRVLAVGETGLDKRCATPLSLQEEAFTAVVRLAERHHKPLIIHAVRATAEITALRKRLRPQCPWILHGFRGKKELAAEWLRQGCYLSFGLHYATDALQAVPLDRLLIETDDSPADIHTLYERAALLRGMPVEAFTARIAQTADFLFFNR